VNGDTAWIFIPNTLSSMAVRFEESEDRSVARVVSRRRPHLGVVFVYIFLSGSFASMSGVALLFAPGLSSDARLMLKVGIVFAALLGISMLTLLFATTWRHAKGPAWIEYDRSSKSFRVPRQNIEFTKLDKPTVCIVMLTGSTQPTRNANRNRMLLAQAQIGPIPDSGNARIPLITRTSNGSATVGAFRKFAAAAGIRYEEVSISPDRGPSMQEIGRFRHDAY
jgi:hypothetical protein